MRWEVDVKATCEMLVAVEAESAADALRLARSGDYEPLTQWEEKRDFRTSGRARFAGWGTTFEERA